MGNCCIIWILLLLCNNRCGGNNCGISHRHFDCDHNDRNDCCRHEYDNCDSLIQPRGFFNSCTTCGCEDKND